MKNKKSLNLIQIEIAVLVAFGIVICLVFYPFSICISVYGYDMVSSATTAQEVEFWTQLVFYELVSLPCFVILFFVNKMAKAIDSDEVFTHEFAKNLKICAYILTVETAVFVIGFTIFSILGWFGIGVSGLFIPVLSIIAITVLFTLNKYVLKAAELKEETDGTI